MEAGLSWRNSNLGIIEAYGYKDATPRTPFVQVRFTFLTITT